MREVWNSTRYRPSNDPKSIYSRECRKKKKKTAGLGSVQQWGWLKRPRCPIYIKYIQLQVFIGYLQTQTPRLSPLQLEGAAGLSVPEKVLRLSTLNPKKICGFSTSFCGRIHPNNSSGVVVAVILVFFPSHLWKVKVACRNPGS